MKEKILAHLKRQSGPVTPDIIADDLKLSTSEVLSALTLLELEEKVSERGGRYRAAGAAPQPKAARAAGARPPKSKASREARKAPKAESRKRKAKRPTGSRGYRMVQSCSTRRRDVATGQLVPSCNVPPKVEKGYWDDLEVKVLMRCDESGEPAFVVVRSVDNADVRQLRSRVRKGEISSSDFAGYMETLKEEIQGELQRKFDNARSTAAFESSLKSDQAKKAYKTQQAKREKLSDEDKKQAENQAKALESRIEALRADLGKLKGPKRENLRRRLGRLETARGQLLKIAEGKAYKWPSASALR